VSTLCCSVVVRRSAQVVGATLIKHAIHQCCIYLSAFCFTSLPTVFISSSAAACRSHKINIYTNKANYFDVLDPCAHHQCPPDQVCQLDATRKATCRCSDTCPPGFSPVCASDGLTYPSHCALRAEACRLRKDIRLLYDGECTSG
jgi:hypothetical protein